MIDDLLLQNWSTLHSHSIDLKFWLRQSGSGQTRLLPRPAPVGREHRPLPPHQNGPSQGMLNATVSRVDSDFCRAAQNNVIVRTDGTVAPCFPMYGATYDWGNIDGHNFERESLAKMKQTCQQHCVSTLNHSLAYCYNDARVIKFVWTNLVKNRARGGNAQSFDDCGTKKPEEEQERQGAPASAA